MLVPLTNLPFLMTFKFSGWLFKVELSKPQEVDELMDEDQYQQFLKNHE